MLTVLVNLFFILEFGYKSKHSGSSHLSGKFPRITESFRNYSQLFMIDVLLILSCFLLFLTCVYTDESTSSRANITDDSQSHQYLTLEIVSSQSRAAVSVDGSTVLLVYIL